MARLCPSNIEECLSWSASILDTALPWILSLISRLRRLADLVPNRDLHHLRALHAAGAAERHVSSRNERVQLMGSGTAKIVV